MFFRELSSEDETLFRAWARETYKPFSDISGIWHPVVQDECRKINEENAVYSPDSTPIQ
jgi:hypothetical protein